MEPGSRSARLRPLGDGRCGDEDHGHSYPVGVPDHVGWYPESRDSSRQRYWDGQRWSLPVRAGTPATADSVPTRLAG